MNYKNDKSKTLKANLNYNELHVNFKDFMPG